MNFLTFENLKLCTPCNVDQYKHLFSGPRSIKRILADDITVKEKLWALFKCGVLDDETLSSLALLFAKKAMAKSGYKNGALNRLLDETRKFRAENINQEKLKKLKSEARSSLSKLKKEVISADKKREYMAAHVCVESAAKPRASSACHKAALSYYELLKLRENKFAKADDRMIAFLRTHLTKDDD